MINKKIVVIIPARGVHKIKKKNIYEIWNKPMIYWVIRLVKFKIYR